MVANANWSSDTSWQSLFYSKLFILLYITDDDWPIVHVDI